MQEKERKKDKKTFFRAHYSSKINKLNYRLKSQGKPMSFKQVNSSIQEK